MHIPSSRQSQTKQRRPRSTYSGEVRLLGNLDGLTVDSLDEHVGSDSDVSEGPVEFVRMFGLVVLVVVWSTLLHLPPQLSSDVSENRDVSGCSTSRIHELGTVHI